MELCLFFRKMILFLSYIEVVSEKAKIRRKNENIYRNYDLKKRHHANVYRKYDEFSVRV